MYRNNGRTTLRPLKFLKLKMFEKGENYTKLLIITQHMPIGETVNCQ